MCDRVCSRYVMCYTTEAYAALHYREGLFACLRCVLCVYVPVCRDVFIVPLPLQLMRGFEKKCDTASTKLNSIFFRFAVLFFFQFFFSFFLFSVFIRFVLFSLLWWVHICYTLQNQNDWSYFSMWYTRKMCVFTHLTLARSYALRLW